MRANSSRWLIALPAILLAVWPHPVQAEPLPGLNAVGYTINQIPPTKSDAIYPTCGSEVENNINRNFNGEPFQQCGDDNFMVHYTGFITVPANNTIQFMVAADDGGTVKIGLEEFGTWNDKGCSWSTQTNFALPAGTYPLDGWFYEHGGGTCYMLAWRINLGPWAIVPDSAFTRNDVTPTTTTTEATTTTTTTEPPTTTTEATTTTTEPPTTTTEATTTTTEPATTTTEQTTTTTTTTVYVPPLTTTSTTTTTTTTTTEPPITTTEATTTTTEPATTTTQATTTTVVQTTVPQTTTTEVAPTTIPETTTTTSAPPSTTTVPPQPVTIPPSVTTEQAVTLILTVALEELPVEQLKEVFEAINTDELTEAEGEAIAEQLNTQSDEVKAEFQDAVNVFSGLFDSFIQVGQTVTVGERRTLIAVANSLVAAGPISLRRRNRNVQKTR